MATIVLDKRSAHTQGLFVSITSPSKAAHLGLSPISTTTAKQTETPRKLKDQYNESKTKVSDQDDDDNNNHTEEDELQNQQDALTPLGFKRSDSWSSRAGFSPRPKRANNPTRRPVQSAASIRALKTKEKVEEEQENAAQELPEVVAEIAKTIPKSESFKLGNQNQHSALERIQESETSDDDDEGEDDQDAEYDGDGEDGEALHLYKSLSSDLSVRYDSRPRKVGSHDAYDQEDDDIVRI